MHQIGIIGDTGMVGSEIDKILRLHDKVIVVYKKNSTREEGKLEDCDLVFLATKDEQSMEEAPVALDLGKKVIDLSGAFRLPLKQFEEWYFEHTSPELINTAVYGLPAHYLNEIRDAQLVANPGCYATSVILALKPLLNKGLVKETASISAISGISGARKEVEETSNMRTYSYGTKHKHVPEMSFYSGFNITYFTPTVSESVYKGIDTNITVELSDPMKGKPVNSAKNIIENEISNYYCIDDLVEVHTFDEMPNLGTKDVNDTHKNLIRVGVQNGFVFINSLIDNLGKGAASQAVENMNIMLGLSRLYSIDHTYQTS